MNRRLEQLFLAQVERVPNAGAVCDTHRYTYSELDWRSNQLANLLLRSGLKPGDRVCVLLPKSANAVSALLGIWKAGAVYVPLDIKAPVPRLIRMLSTCQPAWMIASSQCAKEVQECLCHIPASDRPRECWMDSSENGCGSTAVLTARQIELADGCAPRLDRPPSENAFIMFTSGSSGEPKGVLIQHLPLVELFSWVITKFALDENDRVAFNAQLHFDSSIWDTFCALGSGAELHLGPPTMTLFPNQAAEFIRRSRITQWASVPSVLTALIHRGGGASG